MEYITFGGVKSSTYDIYISGEGIFNAPERDAEAIAIPGRDGDFILDHGNYKNITVTYPAYTKQSTYASFISNIDNFRNAIASKTGYQRLTDTFHDTEYRMAAFIGGLEVDPFLYNSGARFDIIFECKPQRFLTSGETKTTLSNPATVTNPTLFESHPMLEVYGEGDITINSDVISVDNDYIGDVILAEDRVGGYQGFTINLDLGLVQYANPGDTITMEISQYNGARYATRWQVDSGTITSGTATGSGSGSSSITTSQPGLGTGMVRIRADFDLLSFAYGTSSTKTLTTSVSIVSSAYGTLTGTISSTVVYNGTNQFQVNSSTTLPSHTSIDSESWESGTITLDSTQSVLGTPLYIDLDIGEAYKIENGAAVSVNNAVTIPAELPVLKSGSNTISYDNTFTKVDLIPRWWKI